MYRYNIIAVIFLMLPAVTLAQGYWDSSSYSLDREYLGQGGNYSYDLIDAYNDWESINGPIRDRDHARRVNSAVLDMNEVNEAIPQDAVESFTCLAGRENLPFSNWHTVALSRDDTWMFGRSLRVWSRTDFNGISFSFYSDDEEVQRINYVRDTGVSFLAQEIQFPRSVTLGECTIRLVGYTDRVFFPRDTGLEIVAD